MKRKLSEMRESRCKKELKGENSQLIGQFVDAKLSTDEVERKNRYYIPLGDAEGPQLGIFDKPLPCCGCGIGWFCFLVGFVCPLTWYYATILYFCNYYQKDPRERAGLATSAMAAMLFTIGVFIVIAIVVL